MTNKRVELITKLGPKGQLVLRKEIRETLGIKGGSMLKATLIDKKIIIEPIELKEELKKIEALAKKISKKWPKGLSAVEAIKRERR